MITFQRILVPIDFGEPSRRALEVATSLVERFGATVVLLHCFEVPSLVYEGMMVSPVDLLTPIQEAAKRQLDAELAVLRSHVPRAKGILATGAPWEEVLNAVKDEDIDLIVIGTHGRRGVSRALLGSVAEKVVRLSPVPVLTVRGTKEGSIDD